MRETKKNNEILQDQTFEKWFRYVAEKINFDQYGELTIEEVVEMHKKIFSGDKFKRISEAGSWIEQQRYARNEQGNYFVVNEDYSKGVAIVINPEEKYKEGFYFFDNNWDDHELTNVQNHLEILMFIHTTSELSNEEGLGNGWEIVSSGE